jgi:tetratricopeptide (TPR) repeat protein
VEVARALNSIGTVLEEMGRMEESVRYYEQARVMATELVGPEHPLVALTIDNEGEALNALRRYEQARPLIERAIQIWRNAGSGAFYVGYALTNLGETMLGLGEARAAQDDLEEALRLYATSPAASLAPTRFALARALWTTPEQRPRALTLAREAQAEYARGGAAKWRLAEVQAWLRKHSVR